LIRLQSLLLPFALFILCHGIAIPCRNIAIPWHRIAIPWHKITFTSLLIDFIFGFGLFMSPSGKTFVIGCFTDSIRFSVRRGCHCGLRPAISRVKPAITKGEPLTKGIAGQARNDGKGEPLTVKTDFDGMGVASFYVCSEARNISYILHSEWADTSFSMRNVYKMVTKVPYSK